MDNSHPSEQMLKTNTAPMSGMDGFVELFSPSSFCNELDALEAPLEPPPTQKPFSVPANSGSKVSSDASVAPMVGPEASAAPAPSSVEGFTLQDINSLLGVTPAPAPATVVPSIMTTANVPSPSPDPILTAMATITEAETPAAAAFALAAPAPAPTSVAHVPQPVISDNSAVPSSIMMTPIMASILQKMALQSTTKSLGEEKQGPSEVRQYIEGLPTELDVLLGRGGRSNHHAGNKRYRTEVENLQEWYKQSSRSEKQNLSQSLVEYVTSYGGRFLKLDKAAGQWYIVSNSVARRKASQALREYVPMHERLARKASAA